MNAYNADKKIILAQMVRNENENNRIRMKTREQLLYGKNIPVQEQIIQDMETPNLRFTSLKLRAIVAVLLLIGFIAWDNGYYKTSPRHTGQIYTLISDNHIVGNLFAFIEDIPYTLESK